MDGGERSVNLPNTQYAGLQGEFHSEKAFNRIFLSHEFTLVTKQRDLVLKRRVACRDMGNRKL